MTEGPGETLGGAQADVADRPVPPPRSEGRAAPKSGLRGLNAMVGLRELYAARRLTASLVARDLKVQHRGTFLGMLWSLTNPLLLVGMYYCVFRFILGASPAPDALRPNGELVPFAVYFFSGLIIWNIFSNSLSAATTSVIGSGYLLRKVYFPRAVLPLTTVLSSLVSFGFELLVLLVVVLAFVGLPSLHLLWVPAIVLIVALLAYGGALILSAVTVFLRDVAHFIGIVLNLMFWATPVIYSLQFVAERPGLLRILRANPMTGPVVSFRNVVVLNRAPELGLLAYDLVFALVLVAIGTYLFGRWQRLFAEIV